MKILSTIVIGLTIGLFGSACIILSLEYLHKSPDYGEARQMTREDLTCDIVSHTITLKPATYSDYFGRAIELCGWAPLLQKCLDDWSNTPSPRSSPPCDAIINGSGSSTLGIFGAADDTSCITMSDSSKVGGGCK